MPERIIFLTLGFVATLTQTLLIRAMMNRLGGSEMAVGLAIAGWLLLSGLVSFASGKIIDRTAGRGVLLTLLMAALPLALGLGLLLLIRSPVWLGIAGGIAPSPLEFTLCAALTVAPSALLLGLSFNLCVALKRDSFGASMKNVYLYQAAGAALGGFITAWMLLEIISSVGLAWLILAVCGAVALLSLSTGEYRSKAALVGVSVLVVSGALLLLALGGAWRLPSGVDASQISDIRENRFGVLSLLESDGESVIFSGSRPISDNRRPENDEELLLLAHCLQPGAKSSAWLGGPLAGPYNLAQQYAFWNRYVYVNPDRDFVELEQRRIAQQSGNSKPLKLEYQDMRAYIREGSERFDMLVVNGGDPDTLATNRIYTVEFFRQAASRLTDGGVLLLFALEPGNYISQAEAGFLAAMAADLRSVFKYTTLLPFSRYTFAASNSPELKQYAGSIDVELQMITPIPKYFTHEFVNDRLSTSRMEMLAQALQKAVSANITVNSDSRPTALLQKILLDASRFGNKTVSLSVWLKKGPVWIYGIFGVLFIATLLLRANRLRPFSPLAAVAFSGAAGMMLEITLMNTYQSRYGELYQMLGAMLAAYMAGLGCGAYTAYRLLKKGPGWNRAALLISLLKLCAILLLSAAFLHYDAAINDSGLCGLLFIALLFSAAALAGAAFLLASTLLRTGGDEAFAFKAGILAAADHILPALAAAALSVLVMPLIGSTAALLAAAALCLSAAAANFGK